MRKVVFIVALAIIGCKETKDDSVDAAPVAPVIAQILSMGCSASQRGHNVHVSCADGSVADLTNAPGYFYVKDFLGTEYPNLVLVSGTTFYNKTTGDVLDYAAGSLPKASTVYFDQMGCTGGSYISSQHLVANAIVLNDNAYPSNVQAFRATGPGVGITALSVFVNGACRTETDVQGTGLFMGSWYKVDAVAALDASSPTTLHSPIQYMMAQ